MRIGVIVNQSAARRPASIDHLIEQVAGIKGEAVAFDGRRLKVKTQLSMPDAAPPSVVLAALGERMLRLAVEQTGGTAWARADRAFGRYGQLPSYRAMLDRAGVTSPADL